MIDEHLTEIEHAVLREDEKPPIKAILGLVRIFLNTLERIAVALEAKNG